MVNIKSTENRKPYSGLTRSLVIAIDVGTTFSGVSYAILEPGEIPKIHGVTRFPGQEHVAGNSKIPSVVYYDKGGKMMAAGAEADTTSVLSQAEDEGWIKAELFKLRLRPRTMQLNMNGMRLGPLPRRKTAVHVFGDFLAYLYRCTRNFITDTHGNGAALWNAVEQDIQFVLSHPNGWEGAQQTKMRRSAVYGGLIPDTNEGKARIRFVTEGEASLHACVLNGLAADVLSNPSKHGFLIADAGGGTLDISAYAIRGTAPLVMEEVAPPDCIFAGSVFVSRRAREFLEEKLKGSRYGTPAALDHITQRFDETTKRLFRDRKDLQFIPFGSPLDKDPAVGIRAGQLKLTGNEVANLFEPSVDAAVTAIKAQIEASHGIIRSVFLVGGYAASPWLFNQLQERLAPLSITVSRPDTQTSKAVADGAIGFYCDHHVSARMSKFMYGVEFLRELNPRDPDHVARKERLCELPSGPKLLPDAFDCILNRSVKVKESTVFTRKYCTELTSLSMLSVFEVEIWCYRGGNVVPKWIDRQADDFSTLCVVRADLSPLSSSAEAKPGKNGRTYWTIVFSVEIHFGLTEFKARIKWVDDGKTKYGPASIVYNERGHRAEEEEPDSYPEDDVGIPPSPRNDRLRSEPASGARTPTEHFFPSSGHGENSRRASTFGPPETGHIPPPLEVPEILHERTPSLSRGLASSSTSFAPEALRDLPRSADLHKHEEKEKKTGKGKDKTPKLADTLSAVWGAINPATNPPSPIAVPVEEPKVNESPFASLAKGKGKERKNSLDATSSKPSPGIASSRSPLNKQDLIPPDNISPKPPPAVITNPSPLGKTEPTIPEVPGPSPPEAPPPSQSPLTGKKKKKANTKIDTTVAPSSGLLSALTPVAMPLAPEPLHQSVDATPAIVEKQVDVAPEVTEVQPTAPAAPLTPKPPSAILSPVALNDAAPPAGASSELPAAIITDAVATENTSALFSSSSIWDTGNDLTNNSESFGWGTSGLKTPKTPKATKSNASPITPSGKSPKVGGASSWGAKKSPFDAPSALEPPITSNPESSPQPPAAKSPWGAKKSPLDAPTASESLVLSKPEGSPQPSAAKSPWGAKKSPLDAPSASEPTPPSKPEGSPNPLASTVPVETPVPIGDTLEATDPWSLDANTTTHKPIVDSAAEKQETSEKPASPKPDPAPLETPADAAAASAETPVPDPPAAESKAEPTPVPGSQNKVPLNEPTTELSTEPEAPAEVVSPIADTGDDAAAADEDKDDKDKDDGKNKKGGKATAPAKKKKGKGKK